jgi:predicted nuclease with RNAse H fold
MVRLPMQEVRVIGIDCSTTESSVAVSVGHVDHDEEVVIDDVVVCGPPVRSSLDVVVDHIDSKMRTLLALDAPLGWPADLGRALCRHVAGELIDVDSNLLFRRVTDRVVKEKINQQPLDVGADRIARTAHWALKFLGGLRTRLSTSIPLVWNSDWSGVAAIEVYPAATLKSIGIKVGPYKKNEDVAARRELISKLSEAVSLQKSVSVLEGCADAIDAVVCVLAGVDFLRGVCIEPSDENIVKKEGWIWVCKPKRNAPEA